MQSTRVSVICESAGTGRQARLRGVCQPTWEFDSPLSHHKGAVAMIQVAAAPFNFSYRKTFDIKPKARSVGSNENLPTSLFSFSVLLL